MGQFLWTAALRPDQGHQALSQGAPQSQELAKVQGGEVSIGSLYDRGNAQMVLRQEEPTLRHDCRICTGRGMTLQVPPMSDMQGTVMTYVYHHTLPECVCVCAPPHPLYLSPSPLF